MRIFLVQAARDPVVGLLPIDDSAPIPVPEELRATLRGAPTLTGASFVAADLDDALAIWTVARGEVQGRTDDDGLEISLLPLLLMLGRDLELLECGDVQVSLQ